MTDPIYHIHRRRRVHRKKFYKNKYQPYPHPDRFKRVVDYLVYAVTIFVPTMTALQASKIWLEKDAEGISIVTWGGFASANVVWILYGILHKEKPLIFMYISLFIFNVSIVIGAILYG